MALDVGEMTMIPNSPDLGRCLKCGGELSAGPVGRQCMRCLLAGARQAGAAELTEEPSMPLDATVGRRVKYFGDYELLKKIGQGGMGEVFEARQCSLGRKVAIKFLAGALHSDCKLRARFHAEPRMQALLQHPGIVPVYEVGEHEGQLYFSMEYVPGVDLARMTKERPLSPWQAADYVEAVARAVHYAHEKRVLHRDLKPSNILVGADGRARVTDFGLARNLATDQRLTLSGPVLGTPEYLAPEVATGESGAATVLSDVYSLGAVLYHLLTGRPPFAGSTPLETLQLVQGTEVVPPRRWNPAIPRDLQTITLHSLEKEPGRRYPSAAAMAEDLARWREGRPILVRPPGPVERTSMWAKRRPVVAGLAGACALLLVAALAILGWGLHRSRRAELQARAQRVPLHDILGEGYRDNGGRTG